MFRMEDREYERIGLGELVPGEQGTHAEGHSVNRENKKKYWFLLHNRDCREYHAE